VRSRKLHDALTAFAEEAADCLAAERARGAEMPYDVVKVGATPRGGTPLYCYRPMTSEFILERSERLRNLGTHDPAWQSLAATQGVANYVRARAHSHVRADRGACAEIALLVFLAEVFEDATDFELRRERLERAYGALESAAFEDASNTLLVGVLRGLEIASPDVPLGAGLALMHRKALADLPPSPLTAGDDADQGVLAVLSVESGPGEAIELGDARAALIELAGAIALFGDACVALDAAGWMRINEGPWQAVVLGRQASARGRLRIAVAQEDELRAFCSLVSRRAPREGELAWALERFRMGCEHAPLQGMTDHLLALRALLEPEGPQSGRLPGRLAALCAMPDDRAALAERVAHAVALERAVAAGLDAADPAAEDVAEELASHLRALLRDVICGHLDSDLCGLADRLIAEVAAEQAAEEAYEAAEPELAPA
jgi:hypothetical protein